MTSVLCLCLFIFWTNFERGWSKKWTLYSKIYYIFEIINLPCLFLSQKLSKKILTFTQNIYGRVTEIYIRNRVSYIYLDPEAVFQLLLFVKTQVTFGGISLSCFISLIKWLCTWTIFAQLLYCCYCYAQFFHQRVKRFWQKTEAKLWSHPPYDV
jgi:hypothetical protein